MAMNSPDPLALFDCLSAGGQSYERLTVDDLATLIHTHRLTMTSLVRVHAGNEWVPVHRWFSPPPPPTPPFWTWNKSLALFTFIVLAITLTCILLLQQNHARNFNEVYLHPLLNIESNILSGNYHSAIRQQRSYSTLHSQWLLEHNLDSEVRALGTYLYLASIHQEDGLSDAGELAQEGRTYLLETIQSVAALR